MSIYGYYSPLLPMTRSLKPIFGQSPTQPGKHTEQDNLQILFEHLLPKLREGEGLVIGSNRTDGSSSVKRLGIKVWNSRLQPEHVHLSRISDTGLFQLVNLSNLPVRVGRTIGDSKLVGRYETATLRPNNKFHILCDQSDDNLWLTLRMPEVH